jgi:hypothetical protein
MSESKTTSNLKKDYGCLSKNELENQKEIDDLKELVRDFIIGFNTDIFGVFPNGNSAFGCDEGTVCGNEYLRKLRSRFATLDSTYLEMEDSTSEVNDLNKIFLLLQNKREIVLKLQFLLMQVIRTGKEVKQEAISQDPFSDEIGMNMMDAFDMAIEDAEEFISETSPDNNKQQHDKQLPTH